MNKRYLKYILMIIFLQFLFGASTLHKIEEQPVNQSYMVPFYNEQIKNIPIHISAQRYLLKAKFTLADNQIESIYINGIRILMQKVKKRGTTETDYFLVDKSKVKNGLNVFEIRFLKNYTGDVDFRVRNYQKAFFNGIFIFFDDSLLIKEHFNLMNSIKNFVIFGLFFYITFALFNITHRRVLIERHFVGYLTSLSPFIIFFLLLRGVSIISNYNILLKEYLFCAFLIANLFLYYFIFAIRNIRVLNGKDILSNILSGFFVALISIFILFTAGEAIMRLYVRNSKEVSIFKLADRYISYSLRPKFNSKFAGVAVTTNSWGFAGKRNTA